MPVSMEKYDPLVIPAPVKGMNMNIDEESLPGSYAASMVNFIPNPLGSITLRNGTQKEEQYVDKVVLYVIPYMKQDGTEDYLTVCRNADPTKCDLFCHATLLFTFSASARMWGFPCMGKLLLCDGLDPIQVFDETNVSVTPLSQQLTLGLQKNGTNFSVVGNYAGIHLNSHVYALKNDTRYTVTIVSPTVFNLTDQNGNQPEISVNNQVTFVVYPPYSAFCTVIGGRFWLTGEGATSLEFKAKSQSMLISYSFNLNTLTSFLDPKTGLMPVISLNNISSVFDSLDRIEQYKNFLVFFGKQQIYFYNGFYPETEGFGLFKAIPFGLYHCDLMKKIGEDIIFFSYGGIKKISNVLGSSPSNSNVTIDVSISDINGLDLFVNDIQRSITSTDYLYCSSVFYTDKKQVMFKLGQVETIVFSIFNEQYIPYLYSGDFTYSYALAEGRSIVYLAYRDSVLSYQEEKENETDFLFGNISFVWKSPTLNMDIKTFTTQHMVINAECDPEFEVGIKNDSCSLIVDISGFNGINFSFSKSLSFQSAGDFLSGFDVRRVNNYGVLPSVEFKQSLSLGFNKASITVRGESSSGRIKLKNISMRGIYSHGR